MDQSKVRETLVMNKIQRKHEINNDFIGFLSMTDWSCNSAHNSKQSHALFANVRWTAEWVKTVFLNVKNVFFFFLMLKTFFLRYVSIDVNNKENFPFYFYANMLVLNVLLDKHPTKLLQKNVP